MIPRRVIKIKIFLSVVIPVVKAAFVPFSATGKNPAIVRVARICVVSPYPVPDTATALPKQARYQLRYTRLLSFYPAGRILPNQARYQLRYTRIFNFCHDTTASGKNKVFSVCGHSCGQNRFCAVFCNRGKSRKRRCRKALRRFASSYPGYNHGTPKASALPTALIPDMKFRLIRRPDVLTQECVCKWLRHRT